MGVGIQVENLNAWYGKTQALQDISLNVLANHATALIGPSGCGKSTFIRCLNRMHETIPEARVNGHVRIGDLDAYNSTSASQLRRRVGMVFQKPNPFPSMSIYDNVASGLKLNGFRDRKKLDEVVERSLNASALWDEVKDFVHKQSGASLSGGQQQRLCIARALAVEPEVLLMDEPCSALDPISTGKIEELIFQLKEQYTIVIVTHNMQQAARVAEFTGFFLLGKLIEFDKTEKIFTNPSDKRTEDYITGRFMRTRFQQGLDELRQKLLRMGGLAEQAVDRACQAYIDRDLARCQMILEGETMINITEREIDEHAFDLLAMQQPMAKDLRFILAVTKINSDLERVGDQAVNIAERVMDMVELPAADLPVDIPRMAAAVSAMVRRALESFIEAKAELAQAVLEMDNVVDRMRDEAFIMLVKTMNDRPEATRQALDALLIARNLERVADHATNIAEDVIFWVRGADVRHNVHELNSSFATFP